MSLEWWNLQDNAKESLIDNLQYVIDCHKIESFEDLESEIDIHDEIFEVADSMVPVYHSELLDLAADNNNLATDVPELGPASGCNFDGSNSPININAANIFERLEEYLWDCWRDIENDPDYLEFYTPPKEMYYFNTHPTRSYVSLDWTVR